MTGDTQSTPHRRAADGFTTTEKVIAGVAAGLVLYEFYLAATGQQLITQAVVETTKKYPAIPFAWGILSSHFFWGAAAVVQDQLSGGG